MAFSKSARPRRPGAYVRYEAEGTVEAPVSQGATVAIPIVHSWGPEQVATPVRSPGQFSAVFGDIDTPGRTAVLQALKGEGIPGKGGAGQVLAYRMTGSGAAKATRQLQNTTPANALRVDALYPGVRGNQLAVTVQTNALNSGAKDLLVLDNTREAERYTFTDLNDLAAAVNDASSLVRLTVLIAGVARSNVTNQALTGGNVGSSLVAGDWTDMLGALDVERFGLLAPYDLTDESILAALVSWTKARNDSGRRFMLVVGGASDDDITSAVARSQSLNDPNIVNVGVGQVVDDDYGTLSTSQLAPRIAGILAARGETKSLTFARLAGVSNLLTGAQGAEIDLAYDAGVVVLARDTVAVAPVHVEKGLTTWTTLNDTARPYTVFRNPKWVRTMQGIENDAVDLGAQPGALGELPVNDKTRNYFKGQIAALMQARELISVVQPGWSVDVDVDPPPSDDDEFVALKVGTRWGRNAEQVFITISNG